MTTSVKSIPAGFHTITPYLIIRDAANAIEFYKKAFNAQEILRIEQADGRIGYAEIRIDNSPIMLADEFPEMEAYSPQQYGGTPVILQVYVDDVDARFDQAIFAGATVFRPVQDQFFGDRSGTLVDPFGYMWNIATHVEDVSAEEIKRRHKESCK